MLTLSKMLKIIREQDHEKQKSMIDALSESDRKKLEKSAANLRKEANKLHAEGEKLRTDRKKSLESTGNISQKKIDIDKIISDEVVLRKEQMGLLPTACDDSLQHAADIILETQQATVSMLQRRMGVGYSQAAKIIDQLEELGLIGPYQGTKPREIMMTQSQWEEIKCERIESMTSTMTTIESELYKIDNMEGHDFEYWCAELLKRNGFQEITVTQGSGDQGVDVLAEKGGIKYAVQCKCYSKDLGNTPIQEVHTGKDFYGCHVGAVMTNRYFTPGAKEAAKRTNTLLWDRDELIKMLEEAT